MKPTRVAVLINATAGSTAGKDDAIRKELSAAFDKHGITADLQFLSGDKLRAGAQAAVIVNGGDGTIRTVASAMVDSGVPFGVVPGGTFNHFAKDLTIPLSVDAAVAIIAAGNLHSIDAGEANGKIFINNSSIGLYPYLVVDRERRQRHGLPKLFAMAWALLRAFRYFPLRRLTIKAEGSTQMVRSPCVFVGNNEYQVTGTAAGTRQRLDSGRLCLLVAKRQNMAGLFLLAVRAILGLLDQSKDLRVASLTSVEIGSRRHKLLVAFDGEVEAIHPPVRYKIRPKALRVFVPSTSGLG